MVRGNLGVHAAQVPVVGRRRGAVVQRLDLLGGQPARLADCDFPFGDPRLKASHRVAHAPVLRRHQQQDGVDVLGGLHVPGEQGVLRLGQRLGHLLVHLVQPDAGRIEQGADVRVGRPQGGGARQLAHRDFIVALGQGRPAAGREPVEGRLAGRPAMASSTERTASADISARSRSSSRRSSCASPRRSACSARSSRSSRCTSRVSGPVASFSAQALELERVGSRFRGRGAVAARRGTARPVDRADGHLRL